MMKLTSVLVATDFSETSESALNYGRELARTFGARLHVLHPEHEFIQPDALEAVGAAGKRSAASRETR